jgi:hypothetical protein
VYRCTDILGLGDSTAHYENVRSGAQDIASVARMNPAGHRYGDVHGAAHRANNF